MLTSDNWKNFKFWTFKDERKWSGSWEKMIRYRREYVLLRYLMVLSRLWNYFGNPWFTVLEFAQQLPMTQLEAILTIWKVYLEGHKVSKSHERKYFSITLKSIKSHFLHLCSIAKVFSGHFDEPKTKKYSRKDHVHW